MNNSNVIDQDLLSQEQNKFKNLLSDSLFNEIQANVELYTKRQSKQSLQNSNFQVFNKTIPEIRITGLKCQNGCGNYASEKTVEVAKNGMPIDFLVCGVCEYGDVNE